ncbi:hypothetical protein [Chryseobacterium sp. SIMBA_028]|uniref:hypothetical protein n=1 Tax=Chryseobacterium sp. SIMBA_028 TaxID=3085771 RepID=UPI00397AFCF8
MKIIFIWLLLSFFNCSEGNTGKSVSNQNIIQSVNTNLQMTKFDIAKYEANIKKDPSYEGYAKDKDTYVKQYHIIKDGYVEEAYTKSLVQNYVEEIITHNRFRDIYIFDNTGTLQSVKHYFGNHLEIGKWEYYQNGAVVKTEDKDENYAFDLNKVLKYGKDKKVDFTKNGEISRSQSKKYNAYVWELNWNTGKMAGDGESYLFKKAILNGNTGAELSVTEYTLNPLAR